MDNYCEKHRQHYMQWIPICPICRGELLANLPGVPVGPSRIRVEDIPNKRGLFLVSAPAVDRAFESARPSKPVQMGLFD